MTEKEFVDCWWEDDAFCIEDAGGKVTRFFGAKVVSQSEAIVEGEGMKSIPLTLTITKRVTVDAVHVNINPEDFDR